MALAKHNRSAVARRKNTKLPLHFCGVLVTDLKEWHGELVLSGAFEPSMQNYFLRFNKKVLKVIPNTVPQECHKWFVVQ
ncbi:MAG: hypothetical protein IPL73_01700 [Candidatus Obscuribacter sp.]|nr:hypothetical protein [Candidatus Obscuribacter sp.]